MLQVNVSSDQDIYRSLLDQAGFEKNLPIYYKTSLRPLERIDFKTTNLNKWAAPENGEKNLNSWTTLKNTNKALESFVRQISLGHMQETKLSIPIGSHPLTTRMFEPINRRYQHFLALSPIIYSADKTMAVCGISNWEDPNTGTEMIYLLELKENKWQIIRFLLVSMS
ncbi:MAG: hypothetical protein ACHQF4_10195 [Sphingobacteriales bacterium]